MIAYMIFVIVLMLAMLGHDIYCRRNLRKYMEDCGRWHEYAKAAMEDGNMETANHCLRKAEECWLTAMRYK